MIAAVNTSVQGVTPSNLYEQKKQQLLDGITMRLDVYGRNHVLNAVVSADVARLILVHLYGDQKELHVSIVTQRLFEDIVLQRITDFANLGENQTKIESQQLLIGVLHSCIEKVTFPIEQSYKKIA
jgi:hypothetical protein